MAAIVTLHTLWLNDALDPSDAMSFPYLAKLTVTTDVDGQVNAYAGGRQRLVRRAGTTRPMSVSLPACSREQVAWLEGHAGRLLVVRDDRGRKLFGTYLTVPVEEHGYDDEADVALSLRELTASEAV